jgi:hypothetical protein
VDYIEIARKMQDYPIIYGLQYIQQDGQFLYKTIGYEELTRYPNLYQLERWAQNGIKELGVSKQVSQISVLCYRRGSANYHQD